MEIKKIALNSIALVLAVGLFIPWLLLLPFYLTHKNSHWCWKLSMDRYPGYWAVLFFRKELVKSHPANEHYVFQMGEIYGLGSVLNFAHILF